jgi:hypothetical protein
MYNEELRSKLSNPEHYDRMIALIMVHNDACKDVDWAANCINICITQVLNGSTYCETGMCRAEGDEDGSILLSLKVSPFWVTCVHLGAMIRSNHLMRTNQ